MNEQRRHEQARTTSPARDTEPSHARERVHTPVGRHTSRLGRKCFEANRRRQAWLLGRDSH
ncbi:hypothetical protein ACOQFL_09285 [Actinopolyspora sp. H202]|uniref:hypothetical protein n=1 Tax=Actinopolyspora sp. H202 TaxID=1500456 RepID=UPI003EE5199C